MNSSAIETDVLLARDGDEAAFRRIVERSASTVCSIALAITKNIQASEDIAQEAFIATWTKLRELRNPASFMPWLRQVTRNQAHMWRRDNHREIGDDIAIAAAVDMRPDADVTLIADEEQRVLHEALEQLPDEAREVLVLYYREEQSTKQVAALLDLTEDAVRQRLARSRSLLRQEVLDRFGRTVRRSAPGAAFVAAVAGAMTFGAPCASAAVIATAGTKAATSGVASAALLHSIALGGLFGWFGVFMGMKELEPFHDEQEARELRKFRDIVLAIITIGCAAIAFASTQSWLASVLAIQGVYVAIFYLYLAKLPRILERRMEWEKSLMPEAAQQTRRQWMWATLGRALGASIGGTVIMAILLRSAF